MICQLCLNRMATRQVTEPSLDGQFAEAQYCQQCYEAKYQNPPPPALFLGPDSRSSIHDPRGCVGHPQRSRGMDHAE